MASSVSTAGVGSALVRNAKSFATAPALLGALFVIGSIKGAFTLPVDLTLVLVVSVTACIVARWLRKGFHVPADILPVAVLFLAFLPGVLLSSWNPYGVGKMVRLFTIVLLCCIGPFFLVRTERDLRNLLWPILVIGTLFAVDAFLDPAEGPDQRYVFNDYTTTGHSVGRVLIAEVVLALEGRIGMPFAVPTIALLVFTAIGTAARAAILAISLSAGFFLILAMLRGRENRKLLVRALVVFLAIVAAGILSIDVAPPVAEKLSESSPGLSQVGDGHARFVELGSGKHLRLVMYEFSARTIASRPAGTGWGDFPVLDLPFELRDFNYPHNLLLETVLEGGWIAGIALVAFGALAFRSALRLLHTSAEGKILVGLFIAATVQAMFSGDIEANRLWFGLGSTILAMTRSSVPWAAIKLPGWWPKEKGVART